VGWRMLPDGAKDLRAWYTDQGHGEGFTAGQRLLKALERTR
jgi:hypothetical protein